MIGHVGGTKKWCVVVEVAIEEGGRGGGKRSGAGGGF